jgi:hypothetical protein
VRVALRAGRAAAGLEAAAAFNLPQARHKGRCKTRACLCHFWTWTSGPVQTNPPAKMLAHWQGPWDWQQPGVACACMAPR